MHCSVISTISGNILSFSNSIKGKYVVFCLSEVSNPIVNKLSSFQNRSSWKDLSSSGLSHDSVFFKRSTRSLEDFLQKLNFSVASSAAKIDSS